MVFCETTGRSNCPYRVLFVGDARSSFLLASHRAFIITDNFFRMAGLMGLRFEAAFLRAALPFCLAHHAFFAAPILARAAALMPRRFCPFDAPVRPALGGRPRCAG